MRHSSVYCVECVCGHYIESESKILECPVCHRGVVMEWPAREVQKAESSRPAQTPAAA